MSNVSKRIPGLLDDLVAYAVDAADVPPLLENSSHRKKEEWEMRRTEKRKAMWLFAEANSELASRIKIIEDKCVEYEKYVTETLTPILLSITDACNTHRSAFRAHRKQVKEAFEETTKNVLQVTSSHPSGTRRAIRNLVREEEKMFRRRRKNLQSHLEKRFRAKAKGAMNAPTLALSTMSPPYISSTLPQSVDDFVKATYSLATQRLLVEIRKKNRR